MRTALISDLHLGVASGGDLLRDPELRAVLLAELRGADRLVLLGDTLELRERPLGAALDHALPVLAELGATLGGVDVVLVPGNHDSRLAEPLLDQLSLEDAPLPLEALSTPRSGPAAAVAAALSPAHLSIAYPGLWVRDDVYATHGHYMDVHLRLPRLECVAAATVSRFAGPPPDPAVPDDYERILRPVYGLAFGAAQAMPRGPRPRDRGPSETAWELLSGARTGSTPRRRLRSRAARAGFPIAVAAVNRLFRAEFDTDIQSETIFQSGIEGAGEVARRLGVDGGQVIMGHTHRAGPHVGEAPWRLPGGGELHNTGNWSFSVPLHPTGRPPGPYWPGTVTWVEDSGPPRRVELLRDRAAEDLMARAARTRRGGGAEARTPASQR